MQTVVSTDGTRIATYVSGTDGPTVVAVHGYPDDHTVWDGLVAEVADTMRVITYDVRGAGASDRPEATSAYRIAQLVDDLVAVLGETSPDRPVHLLAHDWGSIQLWRALTDDRLAGRILSYTSVSGPSLDHSAVWLRDLHKHPLASLNQLAHSYYIGLFQLPKLPQLMIDSGFVDRSTGTHSHDDQRYGVNLYRANIGRDVARPRPEQVGIPVQVLVPRDDSYVTPALAAGAPQPFVRDLRVREITGGHWVVRTRPDVIAGCLGEFVAHVDGAPESRALARARQRGDGAFAGQLVLITGGARGIGRATALEFARNGADVVIADVNDEAAKETVRDLTALGADAASYHLDVTDPEAWEEFATQVRDAHGTPDVVVNNAGIGMGGPFLQTELADWQRVIDVNLWGVVHGSRLFAKQLVDRGQGGHIVNIASAAAFLPSRTLPAYSTTKAAVLMLTECLRAELAAHDIGVTAICPGFVASDITKTTRFVGTDDESQAAMRDRATTAYGRRNYTPERVAKQIVRATRRNTPVVAITVESKLMRLFSSLTPPLARQLAKIDLNAL